MGDLNLSNSSWKTILTAKANNHWISATKSEHGNVNSMVNTTQTGLGHDQIIYENLKQEHEDVSVEYEIEDSGESVGSITQETYPLSYVVPKRRRRRKGSEPKNESAEERATRLAKMSAYAAQRLANENPEQRASRLKRMSEYAAKRLAHETGEQRAKRLARMSAYAAKRLASETPEQRQARLTRMSAYAARRHAMKKKSVPGTSEDSHSNIIYILPS